MLAEILRSGLLPGAVEIMDNLAIQAAEASVQAGYPLDAQALLIVEMDGETVSVSTDFERVMQIVQASGAYEVRIARDDSDRMRIWEGRKSAFSAVGRLSPVSALNTVVLPQPGSPTMPSLTSTSRPDESSSRLASAPCPAHDTVPQGGGVR